MIRVFPLLVLLATPAFGQGQYTDYGTSVPKNGPETLDAGIATYHLERLEAGDFRMELFDVDGTPITTCSINDRGAQTVECLFEGVPFRFSVVQAEHTATYENVDTGEYVTITMLPRPPQRDPIALEPGQPAPRQTPPPEPIIEGTHTVEEAEAAWGAIIKVLSSAYAEWHATIRGTRSAAPAGATACPGGADPECGPGLVFADVTFAITRHGCCSIASALADALCLQSTAQRCCANTICESLCFLGACTCALHGVLWSCPICV